MKRRGTIGLLLLLTGCMAPQLRATKADMTNYERDDFDCGQIAMAAADQRMRKTYRRCMQMRGYSVWEDGEPVPSSPR